MAGLKKKKKDKSSTPNTVLVVFLVFFVLLSIGLGVWVYNERAGYEDMKKRAATAQNSLPSIKTRGDYYEMLYRDLRNAVGNKLDAAEDNEFGPFFQEFWKEDYGNFRNEKNKEAAKKLMMDLRVKLEGKGTDPAYKSDFQTLLDGSRKSEGKLKGELNAEVAKRLRMEDISKKYTESQGNSFKNATDRIDKGNAVALVKAKEKFEQFQAISENNLKLASDLEEKQKELNQKVQEKDDAITLLTRKINAMEKERADLAGGPGGAPAGPAARGNNFMPLVLDVSMGKPLWDSPVGKVTYVNMELRQVTINIGSAHGAKPELTFNIFGANASGRAEKQMKGTIEIIKVVDANTSTARITSLYDSEGNEILMNLQTKGRLLRESETPIRAGDLLFNLFWGTRVAIAGYVSITGETSDNPAEQMRQMDDFMHLLKRNGMQVDAYVDLRDGKVKGNISSKTRYLIRGVDLPGVAPPVKAPPKGADDDDKKEPAKDANPNADRSALIGAASLALRNEALDRGLLLVSQDNFAVLIGYRRTRSANSTATSAFRPTLPYAGAPAGGGVIDLPPRRPDEQKKAPDMEK